MDDRKPPESNVVRLRRDGEPDEEERRRLARTIFASEDDVGTFSRGNLLPPPTLFHTKSHRLSRILSSNSFRGQTIP